MKTVTAREVQHHFAKVAAEVDEGKEVIIRRRGKQDLKLSVCRESSTAEKVDWKKSVEMIERHLSDLPKFEKNLVLEMREEDRF